MYTSLPCTPTSSICVFYQEPEELSLFKGKIDECNGNINIPIKILHNEVKSLKDAISLKTLNKNCLVFNKDTVTISELFQLLIDERCKEINKTSVNIDVNQILINVDLSCFNDPCSSKTQVSLQFFADYVLSKLCAQQAEINTLKQIINNL